jgi:uncharacterized protein YaaQ
VKLAILQVKGSHSGAVLQGLVERGFAVDIISGDKPRGEQSRTSALIAVQDHYVPELMNFVAEHGTTIVTLSNPLLPLVDPGEYHVSSPVPSLDGGATVYLLNLHRYERIR